MTLNEERFESPIPDWSWKTPGADAPGSPWSRGAGPTPTASGGPSGGADPATGVTTAGNGFAYTEASTDGPIWTIEGPTLDAAPGPLTLTFDVHMRFGARAQIADGTLEVQGWSGSAWSTLGPPITGSQQRDATAPYLPSTRFGTYTSRGFSNTDFKFRFLFRRGANQFFANYDCAVDNVTILGPPTGGNGGPSVDDILDTALRVVFVDVSAGNDRNSGLAPNQAKRTIQAGVAAARPGDIVLLKPGTYREIVSVRNKRSSKRLPIWLLAEQPGTVVLSDVWREAESGDVQWRDEGQGVFSAPRRDRPYLGSYSDERGTTRMLFQYDTVRDLRARSLRISSVQGTQNHNKPLYGFASEGGRVFVRIESSSGAPLNPNGRSVTFTGTFGRPLMSVTNTPYLIVDGIKFEGAGNADALATDAASDHLTVRNCVFELSRRCVKVDDFLAEWNEYTQPGFVTWAKDLLGRNPEGTGSLFALAKAHFSNNGNAFLEGGFAERAVAARPAERAEFRFNYLHGVFEGHRFGVFTNSVTVGAPTVMMPLCLIRTPVAHRCVDPTSSVAA